MECTELPPIINGVITYAPDMMADYVEGTVATHSCNEGFVLLGFETRECLIGGIWSNLAARCRRT